MTRAFSPIRLTLPALPLLAVLLASTALTLSSAPGLKAQELASDGYVEQDIELQAERHGTILVQTLLRSHETVWDSIRRSSLVWVSDRPEYPALVKALLSRTSLAGLPVSAAPYAPSTASEFNLRHRFCTDPARPGQWLLLTWMDAASYRAGLTAREIQSMPARYFASEGKTSDQNVEAGLLSRASNGSHTYTAFGGSPSALPACLTAAWPDGSTLPAKEVIASLLTGELPNLMPEYQISREERNGQCPPASDASLTIGIAREERETRLPLDRAGEPIRDAAGAAATALSGPWTYVSGCRAPVERTMQVPEACSYNSMGVTLDGQRLYLLDTIEVVPAVPYPADAEAQATYRLKPGATPRLISDGCMGAPDTLRIRVSEQVTRETQSQACKTVFPPTFLRPAYPNGTYQQARTKTRFITDMPDTVSIADFVVDTYSPWTVAVNTCSNSSTTSKEEYGLHSGCPAGQEGQKFSWRTVSTTVTIFADPARPTVSTVTATPWTAVNACQDITYSSYGGSGSGGADRDPNFDVNGDGRPDFDNLRAAEKYTSQNGGKISTVNAHCGSCNGPTNNSNGQSNKQNGTPGNSKPGNTNTNTSNKPSSNNNSSNKPSSNNNSSGNGGNKPSGNKK